MLMLTKPLMQRSPQTSMLYLLVTVAALVTGCGGSGPGASGGTTKTTPTIIWATPAEISYGTALSATQLDATASVGGTFSFRPAAGTIEAAGMDALTATFTPSDTTNYNSATATVELKVTQASPTVNWATPAAVVYGTALSATQLDATASVPGSFAYSPAAGTVESAGAHTLAVTFTPTDAVDYTTATGTAALSVSQAKPSITWATPAPIAYGTLLSATQLDASANTPGAFVYTPAAGTKEPVGTDTLMVAFTPTDTTDYTTASGSVGLTVNNGPSTPTITWATPAGITYGTALSATQLDASANVPGTFAYSPALGTVEPAGMDSLSVTFTPTDATSYTTATATVTLAVAQATPTITWATPAAIVSGTALSSTQLDATASVPGTFVYSPAVGTIEPTGSDTLSVTFTPTDATDYTTTTDSVTLTVSAMSGPNAVTTLSLIQQMVNLDSLAEYPTGTTHGIADSDDPRKTAPNGAASPTCFYCNVDGGNFYGDMTINGILQHVMLDADGPGVMTRLEVLGPDFSGHDLRVYLDNSTTPAIQADLQALMTGESSYISASPLVFQGGTTITSVLGSGVPAPGLGLYLPIAYAQHILVTYDGPDNISVTDQNPPVLDWIIEYKSLPADTSVTSYSLNDYNNNLPAITTALKSLSPFGFTPSKAPGPFTDGAASSVFNQSVPAGGSATVDLPSGANAIRFLRTNLGSSAAVLAGVTMSMTFDGEQTVHGVPMGDFFGSGNGTESGTGLNNGATMTQSVTSDGTLTSRWTMPYQTSASITLNNTTGAAVSVDLLADIAAYAWGSNSMHFHAFRRMNGPFETTNDFTSRFLFVKGSGVYVGDNETVYEDQTNGDTAYNWFGEGDEMFFVDGALFPQRGTGTEDYYDFAYGNASYFQAPWASQVAFAPQTPNETQDYYDGTTVFNRTRLLDTIPFASSLRFDFEIDDHDQTVNNSVQIDHTAFFYALPGATLEPDTLVSGSTYAVQSNAAGWNVDTTGGNIETQIFKNDKAQQFVFTQSGDNWNIQDVATGKYIGVPGNVTAPGTYLGLVSAGSGCGMNWTITTASGNNDYYTLTNQCSGLNIDLVFAATTPLANIQVYTVNNGEAQQWRFNLMP